MAILTRDSLSGEKNIVVPHFNYNAWQASRISVRLNGAIDPYLFKTGAPAQRIALLPDWFKLSNSKYETIDIPFLIIKQPESSRHAVPAELALLNPLVQRIADTHFSVSPDARSDLGILTIRKSDLKAGEPQFAGEWHRDLDPEVMPIKKMKAMAVAYLRHKGERQDIPSLKKVRSDKEYAAYLISDREGTIFQRRSVPDAKALFSHFNQKANTLAGDSAAIQTGLALRAEANEIFLMNNYTWHKAANATTTGKRSYAHIIYLPTV